MQVFGPNICAFLNICVPLPAHPVRRPHDGILFLEFFNNQNALDDNLENKKLDQLNLFVFGCLMPSIM